MEHELPSSTVTISKASSLSRKVVALVGNPNCGKTTLFNALTGSHYKVANYPGVTVDKREGSLTLSDSSTITLLDLPGTYSLLGMSEDERVATDAINGTLLPTGKPDLLVVVVDATNLERNLYLVSELLDKEIPLILVVNMIDEADLLGIKVYSELLSRALEVPVVMISAKHQRGLDELKGGVEKALLNPSVSRKAGAWIPSTHPHINSLRSDSSSPNLIAEIGSLRYAWCREVVARCTKITSETGHRRLESLDKLLTSKVWGLPIMILIFGVLFQAIFQWAQLPMELISSAVDVLTSGAKKLLPAGVLTDLLSEGIIPGVGNVIVFIPQIAFLFLFLGILEDCGYLSRAAFLLDTIMRKVGLQGRAFIPLLSSFACAVPGILSTRSIPSRKDRLTTIMIAPLMSCSARLPVYAVLIAGFIPPLFLGGIVSLQGITLLGMYITGIVAACIVAWIMKKTVPGSDSSFYLMEMPPLRVPVAKVVLRGVYDAVLSFLKNATTIILACSIIIWFLASYPKPPNDYQGNPVQVSFAGQLGTLLEPAIKPLGFNWEIGFAIVASFPAREVFVTGLSTVYNVSDDEDTHSGIISHLRAKSADGTFSTLTALSLMIFYVFACQCMSTLAVCRRETGSWAWTGGMFIYMTLLAYLASLTVYQIGIRL